MAAKLGNGDVSFRLGNVTPTAVYRGTQEVWSDAPAGRTLYFYDAEFTNDWSTLANWFDDESHTVPASSLPTAADSVITSDFITDNSGDPAVVANFTMFGSSEHFINITVTGMATFNGSSANGGTVTGDATFNDSSLNGGIVTGNATFNGSSRNQGNVQGTATFTGSACNDGGTAGTFVPDPPPSCP